MKELIRGLKNQGELRAQGFVPYGWCRGYLVWDKDTAKRSITRVFPENTDIKFVDSFNALLNE